MVRRKWMAVLGLVVLGLAALSLIVAGVTSLTGSGKPVAKCDGKVMQPGDECDVYGGAGAGAYSYEQRLAEARDGKKRARQTHRVTLIASAPIGAAGLALLVGSLLPKRSGDDAVERLAQQRGWTAGGPEPSMLKVTDSGEPLGALRGRTREGWTFGVHRYSEKTIFWIGLPYDMPTLTVDIGLRDGGLAYTGDDGLAGRLLTPQAVSLARHGGIARFTVSGRSVVHSVPGRLNAPAIDQRVQTFTALASTIPAAMAGSAGR